MTDLEKIIKKFNIQFSEKETKKFPFAYDDKRWISEQDYHMLALYFLKLPFLWEKFNIYHLYEINLRLGIHITFPSTRQELIDTFVDMTYMEDTVQDVKLIDFFKGMENKTLFDKFINYQSGEGYFDIGDKRANILIFYLIDNWNKFTEKDLDKMAELLKIKFKNLNNFDYLDSRKNKIIQIWERIVQISNSKNIIINVLETDDFEINPDLVYTVISELMKEEASPKNQSTKQKDVPYVRGKIFVNYKIISTKELDYLDNPYTELIRLEFVSTSKQNLSDSDENIDYSFEFDNYVMSETYDEDTICQCSIEAEGRKNHYDEHTFYDTIPLYEAKEWFASKLKFIREIYKEAETDAKLEFIDNYLKAVGDLKLNTIIKIDEWFTIRCLIIPPAIERDE